MAVRALTEVLHKFHVIHYIMDVLTIFSLLYKEGRIFRKILNYAFYRTRVEGRGALNRSTAEA